MKTIHLVPIEPIEERYSIQWLAWFKKEFKDNNISYNVIIPPASLTGNKIETGEFLDVIGTNFYKAQQLVILCQLIYEGEIKDDDIILFMDYWFPGVEMLQYIRDGAKKKFKIAGMLHAGTWDPHDFLTRSNMAYWARALETSWLDCADALFVATQFHKKLILQSLINLKPDKIKVTGFPIYADFSEEVESNVTKDIDIVFPHRLASEKQPNLFDKMLDTYAPSSNKLITRKTQENYINKKQYYRDLSRSKIAASFALQETWGIAIQEAVLLGCIPIVPDRLAYSEMYPDVFKIESNVDTPSSEMLNMYRKIIVIFNNFELYKKELESLQRTFLLKGKIAIPNILTECLTL